MKNIYLVGFMGTGKTTVGKILAVKLDKEFIEMDEVIEKEQGCTIKDVFKRYGEPYFRQLETKLLGQLSLRQDLVVSCGGGLICNNDNLSVLKSTGLVVNLIALPHTIHERTKRLGNRPLLDVADPNEAIKELLEKRKIFYSQAHLSIDTETLTPEDVVQKIIEIVHG